MGIRLLQMDRGAGMIAVITAADFIKKINMPYLPSKLGTIQKLTDEESFTM